MRRLNLSTFTGDTDWTDPANAPPDSAKRFKVVSSEVMFEIIGLAGTAPGDAQAAHGTLEVDGWVGYEGAGLPSGAAPTITRGQSLVEAGGDALSTAVRFVASDAEIGGVGRLNLTFTGAGPAAVEVRIVSGARLL